MDTRKKILVVDDVGINRLIPGMILRPFGYEVIEASDGASAINLLSINAVDLVLLDLTMPGLTGVDVLASQIKSPITERPLFVAYTSIESDEHAAYLLSVGFDRVLNKPAKTLILLKLVRELIDSIK